MKVLLLTRESPFQVYCANTLFERGILSEVVLEQGVSFPPAGFSLRKTLSRVGEAVRHPARAVQLARNKLGYKLWFGDRERHEERVLGPRSRALDPKLPVTRAGNLNQPDAVAAIRAKAADLVFVFGTSLLKPAVFEGSRAPFVNMHWGWSPDYRGEGIVSALALGGEAHLGVTVHLIDPGVDSGELLYRERCALDREDNFYSIGLKLAKQGTELFVRAFEDLRRDGKLRGEKQGKGGMLFSSKYMREHPDLYPRAWARLLAERERHAAGQARG